MKTISSRHNPLFKRVRDAMRDPEDEFVLEGRKQVDDAIAAGWQPLLLVTRGETFSEEIFDALSDTRSPQNVLGLFARPKGQKIAAAGGPVVVLDAVQDPGNVGTIIRLAAAFDCGGVLLLPGCADPFAPKAIRASAGAVLRVPVRQATVADVDGMPLFAADGAGEPIDPPAKNAMIVFGNEGSGVSDEIRRRAKLIAIPMSKRVESLNVAASAAILLARSYALRRK
jgi:TrmH family RNA methyltransferase